MPKRDATDSCEGDRIIDEEWTIEEFERGRFRKAVKMRSANLDAAVESVEGEEEEDGIDEQECRRQSFVRIGSLGLEQDSEEEGIEKMVRSYTLDSLKLSFELQSYSCLS